MTMFNGHKNWNHWNVSLWINNDETLYRMALRYTAHAGKGYRYANREAAAKAMLRELRDMGAYQTPDGAPYSAAAIRAAMVGM